MASKDLSYKINVDSSQAVTGVKGFSRAVQDELKKVDSEFDQTATSGEKVAAVLSAMARDLDTELDRAAEAAEALSRALGPELAGRADLGSVITDLQKMGLTFEDIVTDADKLAAALKELDQVQVKGIESGLGGVKTTMGQIPDSARGASSALANMIGNASQDLGALGGLAGSAGVAIGQMGEYAADAALGGEKLGSALKSMALVAGPIAAITAAMSVVSGIMGDIQAEADAAAKRTEDLGKAMEDTASDSIAMSEVLKESTADLDDFSASAGTFSGLVGQYLGDIVSKLPLIGAAFGSSGTDIIDIMRLINLSIYDFGRAGLAGSEGWAEFDAMLREGVATGKITEDQAEAVRQAQAKYSVSLKDATDKQELFNVSAQDANEILQEMEFQTDPLRQYTDQWKILTNDLRDGKIDSEAAAESINFLATSLGLTHDEVIALGKEQLDKQLEANAEGADSAREANKAYREELQKVKEAQRDLRVDMLETDDALQDLAGTFEQIGVRGESLSALFDLQNAPLDVAGQVRDVSLAIDDLSKVAKDVDLSQPLDPSNVKADELLDALDSLRPQIQARIVETFSAGGEDAAIAMANDYVAQVADELDISEVDAAKLLGLEEIETTIRVAVEQSDIDNARSQLEILTGITGETPWTASIALALQAGTISGADAQEKIQAALAGLGVTVPVELKPEVTKEDHDKANRELDQLRNPADKVRVAPIGPQIDPIMAGETKQDLDDVAEPKKPRRAPIHVEPQGLKAADTAIDGVAEDRTADVYVTIHYPDGTTATAGPTGGGPTGGPVLAPTALGAPAPAATSSSGGGGPLTLAVAAPQQQQPVIIHQTIQAAVIGDPFDVQRAVEDANRGLARLMPVRP